MTKINVVTEKCFHFFTFQESQNQQKAVLQGDQFRISPNTLQAHPLLSQQAPHYYENSAELIKRMNLKQNNDQSEIENQLMYSSSKSSNYVAMNPSQFYNDSYKNFVENEEDKEILSQKILPLIPFDPTHNISRCRSTRPCHEYESIDPIR